MAAVEAVTVLEMLAADAATQGASAVHVDLDRDAVRVRLRVDGRLRGWLPATLQPDRLRMAARAIVADDTRRFRDWRVAAHADGDQLAIRLSAERTDPAIETLAGLGLAPSQARSILRALDRPGGVVLVGGMAGSGRRTTIAALASGDARTGSAVSIGLSFPNALMLASADGGGAAIGQALDLDADLVVVDAIEDRAVAARAFEVAEAGRRVIARIAAADAVSAIDRLRALGVDRLALASQLRVVTAQRLARRLCGACRRPTQAANGTAALLGFDPGTVIHESVGCGECGGVGSASRIGVFEAIRVDAPIARLLNDGADAALLTRHAFLNMPRLDSAARTMVREGLIGAEEAIRLSRHAG